MVKLTIYEFYKKIGNYSVPAISDLVGKFNKKLNSYEDRNIAQHKRRCLR